LSATNTKLEDFRRWMLERGRTPGTADLYVKNARACLVDPQGITHRLVSRTLAPNTLRTNLAALRAWAMFVEDAALTKRLADLRLPPPRRLRGKTPLSPKEWQEAIRHLGTCPMPNEALRQVILIMALRGLRAGDVLRVRKPEVERALASGKLGYEGKGRKRIEISAKPIRAQLEALAAMPKWDRVSDLVTRSKDLTVIGNKVRRATRRSGEAMGIAEMTPHRYRHTFATNYLSRLQGDPNAIVKLKQHMAWESVATAARSVESVSQDELDAIGEGMVRDVVSR
jgi:integrase